MIWASRYRFLLLFLAQNRSQRKWSLLYRSCCSCPCCRCRQRKCTMVAPHNIARQDPRSEKTTGQSAWTEPAWIKIWCVFIWWTRYNFLWWIHRYMASRATITTRTIRDENKRCLPQYSTFRIQNDHNYATYPGPSTTAPRREIVWINK